MQIRVLGPLEASVDDRPLALGGAKQRAVLAMLGLEANRAVTADRLIEGLWGDEAPPSAAKMVQTYVWRLRKLLDDDGGAVIVTRGRAYELRIDREQVDAFRLERLVTEAAHAAGNGENGNAARAALALFRGEPLADVADEPFAAPEIRRLDELRLAAAELAIDADLAAGRHQEIVGEIDALLADNPLRERLHAQRMLALYRCGRQAEALEAYRHARQTLVDEIGVEPSPELRRLHDAILRQDPALDIEPASAELARELDTAAAPPLIGRDDGLAAVRGRWQRAAAGTGSLITLVGANGMGKTRLAAEIAGEAHREGASVLYAAGTGPPEAALAAIARTRETRRPALLVIDDADRAPADVRIALRDLDLAVVPALVLATGQEAPALSRLEPRESIVLEPLSPDDVGEIAGFYAPAGAAAVPVETLLATSRGVPRRVHEAASEWARREATRRVDAAADRAEAGRTEARAMVDELAGSVVELQSTRERAGGYDAAEDRVVCPYKGLAPFDADDADYFFGRERLVAELVARLVGAPLLAVVGPSGCGKSSVVRAGLLPALAGGVLPGSHNWIQALIRPGRHPAAELRRATRRLARERRGVLAVDQFEELFTACQDEDERADFVAALVRFAGDGVVVLAVRADFYGRCAAYPALSRLLGANNVLVGPMSRDELERAIERPAERVGLSVEPKLVGALLTDVEGRPGALPLLSTALLELWQHRERRQLRLAAYVRTGGVQGAVARLAEDAYLGLEPRQQAAARTLLLRLTDDGEAGVIVRRRVALDELDAASAEVAARLADRRLLTVSEGSVEVAHEALLREWPRLRTWLEEDVHGRRLHRQLSDAARAWDADARDAGGLYRGARLASALEWAADHDPELNTVERTFLDQSRTATDRANRRLRLVIAGMACLLVLALGAGAVALNERRNALDESVTGAAQRLDAQALLEDELDRSLLLARQAVAMDDSVHTRSNLLAALVRAPAVIGVLHGPGERPIGIDLSPDGRTLAVLDEGGDLTFFDTVTRRAVGPSYPALDHEDLGAGTFDDVRFSPDGSRVAVGGFAPAIVDARSHRLLAGLRVSGERVVRSVRFSPDGRTVFAVLASYPGATPGMWLQRLDAIDGRPLGSEQFLARRPTVVNLMVTSDGRRLVTTSSAGGTVIRDSRTLRPLERLPIHAESAALSADDRTIVLGGRDGAVRFLDLYTGALRPASERHGGSVGHAAFTPDGRGAVTAGADGRVIVWDARRATATETVSGHMGGMSALSITREGSTLYTAASDGEVFVWDLAGTRRLGRPFDIPAGTPFDPVFAVSPDGRSLAVGDSDGAVSLVDVGTLRTFSKPLRATSGRSLSAMRFLPDGRLLAIAGFDGLVTVVDSRTGEVVMRRPGENSPDSAVWGFSFSADGRRMATVSGFGIARLWELPSGRPIGRPFEFGESVVTLSADGRTLAVFRPSGGEVVDVATRKRLRSLTRDEPVHDFAHSTPDGRLLVRAGRDGRIALRSAYPGEPVTGTIGGNIGDVTSAAVSPDGRTIATSSTDGTIRLWDPSTGQRFGAPLPGVPNRAADLAFTPDGAYLIAITNAHRGFRWDMRASSWSRHACAVAGRKLTREEWSDVLPDRDYDPAC